MEITFIYPYREINDESLFNDSLTMLEYTSLRFANYLAFLGVSIKIYSLRSALHNTNNITYDSITSIPDHMDRLIVIDSLNYLHLHANEKYSWLSSSIDDISQRENAINIIEHPVKIITYQELGGDFETSYPIMELNSLFECAFQDEDRIHDHAENQKPYAIVTTNPAHGLQEIVDLWNNSLVNLYILSKTLNYRKKNNLIIPDDLHNIRIINPENCNHMVKVIKNARFHISPELPHTIFNSFAILAQHYGVPTLSYKYKYDHILHKNNMAGINVKNIKDLTYYIHEFSQNDQLINELSQQASIVRSNLHMEKLFEDLSRYLKI